MTAPPRLRASGVTKVYADSADSRVEALRGVDIAVAQGEFLAVTGASGCGKSTLLHLLGALDVPTTGEVWLDEEPLSRLSRTQLAAIRNGRIGFVFQAFHLMPALTAYDNIALPAVLCGMRPRSYNGRIAELLDAMGLAAKADRYPSQLSGGEQQRVAIARALVMQPAVLLADEPTGNLDSDSGEQVMALLREQHRDGQTIVMVTHDLKVASHAGRVVHMRDGFITGDTDLTSAGVDLARRLDSLIQFDGDDLS